METRLEMLERRLGSAEGELRRVKRRLRATWTCAFVAAVGACAVGASPQVWAQVKLTLAMRVAELESKTESMSVLTDPKTGETTVRFTGVNVQVVNGTGSDWGGLNGVGNLIVGYNGLRGGGTDVRTGSHNLVVGTYNNYSSVGGLVAGYFNTISGGFASVSGGSNNTAGGLGASVGGGLSRSALAAHDWRAGTLFQDF